MPGRLLDLGLAALAATALALATWLTPAVGGGVSRPGGAPLGVMCPARLLLEIECPFCGLTRSFVALAHGRLGAAWAHHPAGPLLFACTLAFLAAAATAALRRRPPLSARPGFARAVEAAVLASLLLGLTHHVVS